MENYALELFNCKVFVVDIYEFPEYTVSLENGSGSKGKQHYKRTTSETQTHNLWSHKIKIKYYGLSSK